MLTAALTGVGSALAFAWSAKSMRAPTVDSIGAAA
jgi:hypothetical protein